MVTAVGESTHKPDEVTGEVIEILPNAMFKVRTGAEHIVVAHISGKIRVNFIKLLKGDRVVVELSPYDVTRGRIISRLREPAP